MANQPANPGRTGRGTLGTAARSRQASAEETEQIGNSMTNEELMEKYPEQLQTGFPVVVYLKDTPNDKFVDVYFAQLRKVDRAANVQGTNGPIGLTELELELKAFDTEQIIRHRDVINPQMMEKYGLKEGVVFKGTHIQITDSLTPRDKVHEARPRANNQGQVLVDPSQNVPIYRHTNLTRVAEGSEPPADFVIDFTTTDLMLEDWRAQVESTEEVDA